MGFSRDKVLKALSMGHELLTSRKMAYQIDARKVAVIYNLLRDQKRRKEQLRGRMRDKLELNECLQTIVLSWFNSRYYCLDVVPLFAEEAIEDLKSSFAAPKDSANNVTDMSGKNNQRINQLTTGVITLVNIVMLIALACLFGFAV